MCVCLCECVCVPLCVSDNYHLLKPKLRPLHCTAKKEIICQSGRGAGVAWIMSLPTASKVREVPGVLCMGKGGNTGNCVKPFRRCKNKYLAEKIHFSIRICWPLSCLVSSRFFFCFAVNLHMKLFLFFLLLLLRHLANVIKNFVLFSF